MVKKQSFFVKKPLNVIISTPGGVPRGVQMIKFNGFLTKNYCFFFFLPF